MELSVISEEMSNSATFKDESANDVVENSDADFAAEDILLQLTVDDDPDTECGISSVISPVTSNSGITKSNLCLTGCSTNMPSCLLEKNSSERRMSRRTLSAVAAAQAKVFRQYLLDGDIQARILELDNCSIRAVCLHYKSKLCDIFTKCIIYNLFVMLIYN